MALEKFIIYACPTGELCQQIEAYYQTSQASCGQNSAHQYMPHCSLTGFFEAPISNLSIYLQALHQTHEQMKGHNIPLSVQILGMSFQPKWQGLELKAAHLKQLIADFIQTVEQSDAEVKIRPKDWLHLSLAYGFKPEHEETLKQLAQKAINPDIPTEWELRFYQRHPNWTWTCHSSWLL